MSQRVSGSQRHREVRSSSEHHVVARAVNAGERRRSSAGAQQQRRAAVAENRGSGSNGRDDQTQQRRRAQQQRQTRPRGRARASNSQEGGWADFVPQGLAESTRQRYSRVAPLVQSSQSVEAMIGTIEGMRKGRKWKATSTLTYIGSVAGVLKRSSKKHWLGEASWKDYVRAIRLESLKTEIALPPISL